MSRSDNTIGTVISMIIEHLLDRKDDGERGHADHWHETSRNRLGDGITDMSQIDIQGLNNGERTSCLDATD